MKNYKFILIAFLLGITVFSLFKYLVSLQEKRQLQGSLKQAGMRIVSIEKEKQNLLQTIEKEKDNNQELDRFNSLFKLNLRACNGKIFKLSKELQKEQRLNDELAAQSNLLKSENEVLKKSDEEARAKFVQINLENEAYKAKFSSIVELKKAIRELKLQARKVVTAIQEKIQRRHIIDGNRGYITKDGKPTYPAKIKIEVKPAAEN